MGLQAYTQVLTITNNLRATVEATVRCGSSERYSVSPSKIFLKSGHSCQLQVKLKVLRYVQKRKAAEQGQRDVFHIKVPLDVLLHLLPRNASKPQQDKRTLSVR